MRRCFFLILTISLIFIITIPVFAHSGNTDSSGGHYNHSTGDYHYHHGYPAHYHTNGVCPYQSSGSSSGSSDSSSNIVVIIVVVLCVVYIVLYAMFELGKSKGGITEVFLYLAVVVLMIMGAGLLGC